MSGEMRVVAMGMHVLDVLARPISDLPVGQGAELVDEIAFTVAGTAGGTAVTLAKLGANVRSAAAIGTDPIGDLLLSMLQRFGIDTAMVRRHVGVQTSASVVAIASNGDHPTFHVIGTNATYGCADVEWEAIAAATHLHFGAPELFAGGPEEAAKVLDYARRHDVVTSVDLVAPGSLLAELPGALEPLWPHLDYLLPNDDQILGLTGATTTAEGAASLVDRGVSCVATTCGPRGAEIVDATGLEVVPAFSVELVDTTGCGDAFSAGFLRGLALGRSHRDAAVLGCATSCWVASGIGSDYGDFDLDAVQQLADRGDVIDCFPDP